MHTNTQDDKPNPINPQSPKSATAQEVQDDTQLAQQYAKTATYTEHQRRGQTYYDVTHPEYNEGANKVIGSVRRNYPQTRSSRWVSIYRCQASTKTFKTRNEATADLLLRLAAHTAKN